MQIPIIKNIRPRAMKKWQDCQWLRITCGRSSCPICGPIKRNREENIAKGKDPDSMECAMEFMSSSFKEMLDLLKIGADKFGIDLNTEMPDEDDELDNPITADPLYDKVMDWRQGIYDIAEQSDEITGAWLQTEAGKDIIWYSNILLAKIYRQNSNLKNIEKEGIEYVELEYDYTGYVLGRVLEIIEKSLIDLSTNGGSFERSFNIARLSFDAIKNDIRSVGI